jgi:RHS repeat-associated protein
MRPSKAFTTSGNAGTPLTSKLVNFGASPFRQARTCFLYADEGLIGEYDSAGTPQKIVRANGSIVWSATCDSFGNAQVTLAEITNNLRLSGQYFDEETDLHYNWNRYYDPVIGRYLRVDPLGDGLNLYTYCFSKPNNMTTCCVWGPVQVILPHRCFR